MDSVRLLGAQGRREMCCYCVGIPLFEQTSVLRRGLCRQIVGKIQLTQEEADTHRADPVYLDLDSGFYMFPVRLSFYPACCPALTVLHQPNDQNIIKCAVHGAGFTYRSGPSSVSTPVFPASPSQTDQQDYKTGQFETAVPRAALQELRGHLAQTYPDLANKPWAGTRMCWYTDSADEDWIISFHPLDRGVVFATAGSGHAMKVLRAVVLRVRCLIEPALFSSCPISAAWSLTLSRARWA